MSQTLKRVLSLILTFTMLISMCTVNAHAAEIQSSAEATNNEVDILQQSQTPYIIEEVVENRTESSKDFLLSNGLHLAAVYSDAVHFQKDGHWADIDNTLTLKETRSGNVYVNTEGNWYASFPEKLLNGSAISVSKNGYTLSFGIGGELRAPGEKPEEENEASSTKKESDRLGAETNQEYGAAQRIVSQSKVNPAREVPATVVPTDLNAMRSAAAFQETVTEKLTSKLRYDDVFTNTDIVYDLSASQLKESIILQQYDDALLGYSYVLDPGDMVPVLNDQNEIVLFSSDGDEPIMRLPAPYLFDAAGEFCYDVIVVLEEGDSNYLLSYVLPQQWMADENRQWPVTLDPAIDTIASNTNAEDQIVYENTQYSSPASEIVLNVGYDSTCYSMRTYMRYRTLPALTSADVIVNATMELFCTEKYGSNTIVEVREVLGNWSANTINWNTQPNYSDIVKDYVVTTTQQTFYTWDITDIVRNWYTGSNYGMVFKTTDKQETDRVHSFLRYYSADFTSTSKPTLTIIYRNSAGLEDYWDYTVSSAGRAGTGYVNNYTGNLVWVRDDIGFGGNRMPVAIRHVYNASENGNNTFGLGYGWRTNFNQRLQQVTGNSASYVWEDADGTAHYFSADDSGAYKDEDGLELTLITTGSNETKYCISDKYGNCSYFDTTGRLTKQENNQKTKSNITISYASSSFLISQIKDGAGRIYTFSYSGGLLNRISYKGTGSTELTYLTFAYTNSYLTSVTDKDGKKSVYTYTEAGTTNDPMDILLSSVKDIDGYTLTYTYNTTVAKLPNRVQTIHESDGSAPGNTITFSYAHNQTTLSDTRGNAQIMQFNNWGNTVSVQDNMGRAVFNQYAASGVPIPGNTVVRSVEIGDIKSNRLLVSSGLQNTVVNLLSDSSFEDSTKWTATSGAVTTSVASGTAYLGNKSLKLSSTTTGAAAGARSISVSASADQMYTFSAYVKTESAPAYLVINYGGKNYASEVLAANSDWTRLQVSCTTEAAGNLIAYLMTTGTGTIYMDCVQLEKMPTASRYNLIQRRGFLTNATSDVYQLTGYPTTERRLSQTVNVSGAANDTFVLAGWAKGDSVSLDKDDDIAQEFGMIATFNYTDGTSASKTVRFNPYVGTTQEWQYAANYMKADKAYSSITVQLVYDYNSNCACFKDIQLYKEEFGTQYEYDSNGNIIAATDIQNQKTQYTYDDANNLTQIKLPSGVKLDYTYDAYHNVKTATTETGAIYRFEYDDYGNNTSAKIESGSQSLESSATYSSGGNLLASTTDTSGKTTHYTYNSNTGVLQSVQYPNDTADTETNYAYDNMYRLTAVSATTNTGTTLSAEYSYNDDLMSNLATPSTTYRFHYGNFGQRAGVSIGNRTLATYEYTNETNYLESLAYSNGDSVQYSYDEFGRMTQQRWIGGDTVNYWYDSNGALATVTDSSAGSTAFYYDLVGQYAGSRTDRGWSRYTRDTKGRVIRRDFSTPTTGAQFERFVYDESASNGIADGALLYMKMTSGNYLNYRYDAFQRMTDKYIERDVNVDRQIWERFHYNGGHVSMKEVWIGNTYTHKFSYTYDGNGNITKESDAQNGTTVNYTYDTANQLLTASHASGRNETYTYDNAGNILTFNNGSRTHTYTYGDSDWGDLLTKVDGQSITYDNVGNPLSYYNGYRYTFDWEEGRQLASVTYLGNTTSYEYDQDGIRTKKVRPDGSYIVYEIIDGRAVGETRYTSSGAKEVYIRYIFDENGSVNGIGLWYPGDTAWREYYFAKNLQGDVLAIYNSSHTCVASYSYDAWGNIISKSGILADVNPFRYRSYYYDAETWFYYLQSRYYDPQICRFINADVLVSTGQGLLGNNPFAYCLNNPILFKDGYGNYARPCTTSTLNDEGYEKHYGVGKAISMSIYNRSVYIDAYMTFHGDLDPAILIAGIQEYWEGTYTNGIYTYNFFVNIHLGESVNGHTITVNAYTGTARGNCKWNALTWGTTGESAIMITSDYYEDIPYTWTIAHEFGHSMGVSDYYTQTNAPGFNSQYGSIMNGAGMRVSFYDILKVIDANMYGTRQQWHCVGGL